MESVRSMTLPAGADSRAGHDEGMIRGMRGIPAACRPHLARTAAVAVVVGTILCASGQLDVLLAGRATGITWLEIALTYLVPFLVANYGILAASRNPGRGSIVSASRHSPPG
ncbi:MAG: nitrate/nitrite transporter NrtS [Streptosporangiaceae bacterium]